MAICERNDSPSCSPGSYAIWVHTTRILWLLRHANPKFGPPRLAKYDVKDGFYRLCLRALDCLRLALVLPKYEGESQLVAIPLACTMGWVQLPPTFCTMSKTMCDLANHAIQSNKPADTEHRLEAQPGIDDDLSYSWEPRKKEPKQASADKALEPYSKTALTPTKLKAAAPPSNMPFGKPVGTTNVFMDDYIQVGQGGPRRMRKLRHHLLEAVDQVLAQPGTEVRRNEAISQETAHSVGDTAVFSMNPKVFTLGCCGIPTGKQSHSPGTDSTAHSLPSAVIDK
jgi:hypothetical protein